MKKAEEMRLRDGISKDRDDKWRKVLTCSLRLLIMLIITFLNFFYILRVKIQRAEWLPESDEAVSSNKHVFM